MTSRIDWPTLLGDIAYRLGDDVPGHPGDRVACGERHLADHLQMPRSTIRGWIDGSEPKHGDGEYLLDRWCRLTGKHRQFAPCCRRSLSAAQAR